MHFVYGLLWLVSGIVFLASLAFLLLGGGCVILIGLSGVPTGNEAASILGLGVVTIALVIGSFKACQALMRRLNDGAGRDQSR